MDDGVFKIECPCCGATLEVDAETEAILSHQAPKPKEAPLDLQKAVRQLKSEESSRDQRFREQVQAERQHGKVLDKRFEGLLKKARSEGPQKQFPRDIDLD